MSKKQNNTGVKALCSVLIILLIATISIAIPSKGFTDWSKFKKNPQLEQPDKPGDEQKPGNRRRRHRIQNSDRDRYSGKRRKQDR